MKGTDEEVCKISVDDSYEGVRITVDPVGIGISHKCLDQLCHKNPKTRLLDYNPESLSSTLS